MLLPRPNDMPVSVPPTVFSVFIQKFSALQLLLSISPHPVQGVEEVKASKQTVMGACNLWPEATASVGNMDGHCDII